MAKQLVKMTIRLPYSVKQDSGYYIASCCLLDVHSQGETEEKAAANLTEALQLFIETCFEMGTLEQVLKDCGFTPAIELAEEAEENHYMDVPLPLIAGNSDAQACAH